MGFLRRIFGGGDSDDAASRSQEPSRSGSATPARLDPRDADAAERAYELEIARAEQDRLDDLSQRQLRYADYAWQPPRQGGDRRADDGDVAEEGG